MIGIDLVNNNRIALDLERLANRILSDLELEEYNKFNSRKRKIEYVASRFASKEAIYKAMGKNYGYGFKDFSILNDKEGKPYVKSSLNFNFLISISHEDDYSIAICGII